MSSYLFILTSYEYIFTQWESPPYEETSLQEKKVFTSPQRPQRLWDSSTAYKMYSGCSFFHVKLDRVLI